VLDQLVVPTLVLASRDLGKREITLQDEEFIVTWSRDIFQHLRRAVRPAGPTLACGALGVAAHGSGSGLLLEMLAAELAAGHGAMEVLGPASPTAEVVARVAQRSPQVVCVAALPPEGGPYARQLCQALKERCPGLTVVAFRPSEPGIEPAGAARRLREAGADLVVVTLAEASQALSRLLGAPGPAAGEAGTAPPPPPA
jgi:methylmalonyl-CoA mutase cobalamin-binding subunit